MAATARMWLWCAALVLFVVSGLQGLQARRLDYESDPLGFRRTATDARASEETYLARFGFSVTVLDQVVADTPADEPIVFVHRDDQQMFQEFSILSYAMWPRHLFAVVCTPGGEPERAGMLLPSVARVNLAILDLPSPPDMHGGDATMQLTPTAWLVRSSEPRPWESFCH